MSETDRHTLKKKGRAFRNTGKEKRTSPPPTPPMKSAPPLSFSYLPDIAYNTVVTTVSFECSFHTVVATYLTNFVALSVKRKEGG